MKADKFIKDYTRRCSNELCVVEDKYGKKVISYHEWLTPEQALSAMAIAREEVIEEVLKWLRNNYRNYMHNPTGEKLEAFFGGDMITDLEKELEEEV